MFTAKKSETLDHSNHSHNSIPLTPGVGVRRRVDSEYK